MDGVGVQGHVVDVEADAAQVFVAENALETRTRSCLNSQLSVELKCAIICCFVRHPNAINGRSFLELPPVETANGGKK